MIKKENIVEMASFLKQQNCLAIDFLGAGCVMDGCKMCSAVGDEPKCVLCDDDFELKGNNCSRKFAPTFEL